MVRGMRESISTLTLPVNDFRLTNWLANTTSSDYQETLAPWGVDVQALRTARLLGGLEGEIRVLEEDDDLVAVLRTHQLKWDEEILGRPVICIDAMAGGNIEEKHRLLSRVVVTLRPGQGLLTARIRGDDYPSMHALESVGFRVTDSRNIFLKDFSQDREPTSITEPRSGFIQPYNPTDMKMRATLTRLGTNALRHSRIYNDPSVPRERADYFYEALTERFLDDPDTLVYVATVDDEHVGFVVGKEDADVHEAGGVKLGYLWLITVDEVHMGKGLGLALYQTFEQAMRDKVTLLEAGAQTHNYTVLNIFTRANLKPVSSLVTFHAWIE